MKTLFFALILVSAASAFAATDSETEALAAFNKDKDVQQRLSELNASKGGAPVTMRVSSFGDACELDEVFIIGQPITSDVEPAVRIVSARIEVNTYDRDECEGSGGKQISVSKIKVVDLNQLTR